MTKIVNIVLDRFNFSIISITIVSKKIFFDSIGFCFICGAKYRFLGVDVKTIGKREPAYQNIHSSDIDDCSSNHVISIQFGSYYFCPQSRKI